MRSGNRRAWWRPKRAGNSFRWARSPVPPKITSVNGSGGETAGTNGDGSDASGRTTNSFDIALVLQVRVVNLWWYKTPLAKNFRHDKGKSIVTPGARA